MPDPLIIGTGGAVLAYLSKDGVAKLLGPTADYLGDGLKNFTQKRLENIGAIFANAERKLGDDIHKEGRVPAKVLKEVLDGGSYSENELAIEYFGGVLASSRTDILRDDRGARVSRLVGGMSSYQIRAHYIMYNSVAKLFIGSGYSINHRDRSKMQVYFPMDRFIAAMGFSATELNQLGSIMRHTLFGLHSDSLIENRFEYGDGTKYYLGSTEANGNGVLCQPSALGVDVFLWAHGMGERSLNAIFADDFQSKIDQQVVELAGGRAASQT